MKSGQIGALRNGAGIDFQVMVKGLRTSLGGQVTGDKFSAWSYQLDDPAWQIKGKGKNS